MDGAKGPTAEASFLNPRGGCPSSASFSSSSSSSYARGFPLGPFCSEISPTDVRRVRAPAAVPRPPEAAGGGGGEGAGTGAAGVRHRGIGPEREEQEDRSEDLCLGPDSSGQSGVQEVCVVHV